MSLRDSWATHGLLILVYCHYVTASGYWYDKQQIDKWQLLESFVIASIANFDFQAWIYLFLPMNKLINLSNPPLPHLQDDCHFHTLQYYTDSCMSEWQGDWWMYRTPTALWKLFLLRSFHAPGTVLRILYPHPHFLITNSKKGYTFPCLLRSGSSIHKSKKINLSVVDFPVVKGQEETL